ncbi:MAG: PLP-dependent transferase, partial [Paracoccaceae bacterium]
GIVVDSGKFDWQSDKFPLLNEPESSYHGVRWAHDLGPLSPIAFILRMRVVPLRNLGACTTPDNSWTFLQGIETLPLRMERHCENARSVAEFLNEQSSVDWVRYPGMNDGQTSMVEKYLGPLPKRCATRPLSRKIQFWNLKYQLSNH